LQTQNVWKNVLMDMIDSEPQYSRFSERSVPVLGAFGAIDVSKVWFPENFPNYFKGVRGFF
jgi:uncharacterized protein (UPF0261 family)